jgi:hypothetical protein
LWEGNLLDTTEETPSRRGSPSVWLGGAGLLFLMPVLYVASTGPFVWLIEQKWISETTSDTIILLVYTPILWTAENIPGAESLLEAYIDCWR